MATLIIILLVGSAALDGDVRPLVDDEGPQPRYPDLEDRWTTEPTVGTAGDDDDHDRARKEDQDRPISSTAGQRPRPMPSRELQAPTNRSSADRGAPEAAPLLPLHGYVYSDATPRDEDPMNWTRSTFCENDSCVEVAVYSHSSFCHKGNCVEVAATGDQVAVRDSKNPTRVPLLFSYDEWTAFVKGVRAGEFDF